MENLSQAKSLTSWIILRLDLVINITYLVHTQISPNVVRVALYHVLYVFLRVLKLRFCHNNKYLTLVQCLWHFTVSFHHTVVVPHWFTIWIKFRSCMCHLFFSSAPVLSVVINSTSEMCFSGSSDSTIICWSIPSLDIDPYGPYSKFWVIYIKLSTCRLL